MVVSQFRFNAPGCCNLILGGAELEDVEGLRIVEVTLDFNLTFETRLCNVVSKTAKRLSRAPCRKVI